MCLTYLWLFLDKLCSCVPERAAINRRKKSNISLFSHYDSYVCDPTAYFWTCRSFHTDYNGVSIAPPSGSLLCVSLCCDQVLLSHKLCKLKLLFVHSFHWQSCWGFSPSAISLFHPNHPIALRQGANLQLQQFCYFSYPQGSLKVPKMEFFIKAHIWGLIFFISMQNWFFL